MKKKFKLGIIGCGFMSKAILRGVVLSDFLSGKKIIVSDIDEEKLNSVDELGVYTCNSDKFVAENSEYLILAVHPGDFKAVVKSLGECRQEKIISVIAGLKKSQIKEAFGRQNIKVARCMPNFPCSIGSGAVAIDMSDFNADYGDTEFISKLFSFLGTTISLDESKMDAVTALSVSGPAYVFMFIDSLVDAGVKNGLSRGEAKLLAVQTVLGSAEMVQREEESISELIMRVCGKGSIAIEAVKVLEENNFRETVVKAVDACAERARGLSEK